MLDTYSLPLQTRNQFAFTKRYDRKIWEKNAKYTERFRTFFVFLFSLYTSGGSHLKWNYTGYHPIRGPASHYNHDENENPNDVGNQDENNSPDHYEDDDGYWIPANQQDGQQEQQDADELDGDIEEIEQNQRIDLND